MAGDFVELVSYRGSASHPTWSAGRLIPSFLRLKDTPYLGLQMEAALLRYRMEPSEVTRRRFP